MESPACYTCRTAGLTCKNEDLEAKDIVRKSVNEFYATAAIQSQKNYVVQPVIIQQTYRIFPQKSLNISYGCGSPVTQANIEPGESVLDLGSGGGIDCFIAAKMVGKHGQVIGIDMTDEMLRNANASKRLWRETLVLITFVL